MKLTYRVQQVQKQTYGYDCGVFAIAFATSLLSGDDPAALVYRSDIRQHLLQCLSAKETVSHLRRENQDLQHLR